MRIDRTESEEKGMWEGKKKAVTFSYDDGVTQDRRLVELLNRYGLKATFNLNSGIQSYAEVFENNGIRIHRLNVRELPELYRGHEIAVHCLTHANLAECDEETIYNEISRDKWIHEQTFQCEICGMAYPFGTYNEKVMKIAADCGIRYARTVI
ncbi:MAG: polysaccharide deacetylase family protein, partial [Lachnospiraceae bacterium]|nr:polysaccharide deacetylase family protein [Lachnospiraceae bacterium]